MTINKITSAPTPNEQINKINEIIDNLGDGTVNDVQINGTSIVSSGAANILTNSAYNASNNKIATMSDIPSGTFVAKYGVTSHADILAAYNSGKDILCEATYDSTLKYYLPLTYYSSLSNAFYFTCIADTGTSYHTYIKTNGWSNGVTTTLLERASNKVYSLSSSSTDAQYPSAKCVYDALQNAGSSITITYDV